MLSRTSRLGIDGSLYPCMAIRAEREDKNRGRISASRNSEIFEYSFGVF